MPEQTQKKSIRLEIDFGSLLDNFFLLITAAMDFV
jgi:hypothetical protein